MLSRFTEVADVPDVGALVDLAAACKADPLGQAELGRGRAVCLLFFNPSLRTRLSTQRAAQQLGLACMVMEVGREGWRLDFGDGDVVMDGDTAEHVREAARVVSRYCDVLALRTFPALSDRDEDYGERVLRAFVDYASVPVVSLESATRHPLQGLADLLTIREHAARPDPRIVLTWAPHPRALPQAVANSFCAWTRAAGHRVTVACPPGLELANEVLRGHEVTHDPSVLAEADFVYAKNWSRYRGAYGQRAEGHDDWTVTAEKLGGARFMHCLPVRRGVVVEGAVLDSPASLCVEQAANRTWAAQAVLQSLLTA